MILGVDVSSYLEVLAHGVRFYDGASEIDPLDGFRENGVEYMRIRLWNDPRSPQGEAYLAGTCDLSHYLRLGALAKEKGYKLLMDLHYSDFWADPNKQFPPKAWQGLSLEELTQAVYGFTKDCLEKAKEAGVLPELIQVGNEITNGMLWPLGALQRPDGSRGSYQSFIRLLRAGIRACREAAPEAGIILHLERSFDAEVYQEFFTEMEKAAVDYDIIGASYYPYWHGTPDQLFANLNACKRFGKEIMVMELSYGFTPEPYDLDGQPQRLVIMGDSSFVPGVTDRYAMTPQGQAEFIRDFLARAKENGIDGVFYWEPLWLPAKGLCWASKAGQAYIKEEKSDPNEWANQCLFDYNGQKLPGFSEFCKNFACGICTKR